MALFVLLVVGIVVLQTWLDWKDTRNLSPLPAWAKGTAAASLVAISLASLASYASVWMEGSSEPSMGSASRVFWPEVGFLLCALGVIIAAGRKRRLRWLFVLTGIVVAAFWLGITFAG